MILSRNFVKDYVDISDDYKIEDIANKLTEVGNEYDYAGKLIDCTNLIVGEVISCIKHPDSDHLHLCKVNIGNSILDIVCGAPNVKEGIKVIVAQDGAKLPGGIIKKGKIRGYESNGMLCSIAELGLDNKFLKEEDKNGICELDKNVEVGSNPLKALGLDDEIIDLELTANRGDLLSILGLAHELAAICNLKVKDVDTKYEEIDNSIKDCFNIDIKTDKCSLFLAKKAINVEIKESPDFIKNRLIACGIRPINNVVDISNYVMLELGQPLHFYDADTISKIEVRNAKDGEHLTTLDNIDRTLDCNDIVISDGKPIGLAGVMGGLDTEVTEKTKNIIIESAIFDSVSVRKTSKKILRSEASNRFEKGLDPNRTYMAINRACNLLSKYANADILKDTLVFDNTNKESKTIDITVKNINDILGTSITKEKVIDIFERLGFDVLDKDTLKVTVPRRRLDISIKEDLIEEIGRIYGINNIEGRLPKLGIKCGTFDKTTRMLKNKLVDLGLNEVLTKIFMNEDDCYKYTTDEFEIVKLLDPLSKQASAIRYTLIPSLMEVYKYNKSRNIKDILLFEIGKGYYKNEDKYLEDNKLCGLLSGNYYYKLGNNIEVDFYVVKGIVEDILDYLGYKGRYSYNVPSNIANEFHPGIYADILVQGNKIGMISKINPSEVKEDVYVFEINLDKLYTYRVSKLKYKEVSIYPGVEKDIAFVVDKSEPSENLLKLIKKSGGKLLKEVSIFDVYEGEKIDSNKKSIAFKLLFEDNTKTLTDNEVMDSFNNIIKTVESKMNAKLRDK